MVRTMILAISALAIGALTLAACESSPAAPERTGSPTDLYNTWTLIGLEGNEIDTFVPQGAPNPYLIIAPDCKVSGSTGINSLSSALDAEALAAGGFKLGPIATTRKGGIPAMMVVESEFVDLLRKSETYSVKGSRLTLSRGKDDLLVFMRVETQTTPAAPAGAAK